ncbi:hypothetical protein Bca4012_083232 [Brassica carinata]
MLLDPLPKCLFKEGTETQVDKVNNTCRTSILEVVEKYIEVEYKDVLADPLFAQVMEIYDHKLGYSGRVIHTFVCKQLLTSKRHELWFQYARRPLRFSMQEFYAITGLKYQDDEPDLEIDNWKYDKGFWAKLLRRKKKICLMEIRKVHLKHCNTWSRVDRLRMVYLCVIAGIVMAKDERVAIPHEYIKLVMDFDKMRRYPWGLHSFDALVTSIIAARDKVKEQNSYVVDGFSYALQIWVMEAIPDIGSLLGQKLREGMTSMRCRNWKGSAKVSYQDIMSLESNFASTGHVFAFLSSTGNYDIGLHEDFKRDSEMQDERVDLMMDMIRKMYDWSKHEWGFLETVEPVLESSEDDGSDKEEAGETSDTGMEEDIETTPVSAAKKRKKKYQDTGAESRNKKLLFQRSNEKYRDTEEEMKSYIQVMLKSSVTALALEVRDIVDDRFAKLEDKLLSSQTPGGAPVDTQTQGGARGADPFYTPSAAAAPTPAYTKAPAPTSTRAPVPTPTSTRTTVTASSRSRALATSQTGGLANAAKTRSQTKDPELSNVFGSLFSTLDDNLGTQEHLQKTMGNLTQEYVDGFDPSQDKQSEEPSAFATPMTSFRPEIFKRPFLSDIDDPEVRCKDSDYKLVFVPEDKWSKLIEWTLNPTSISDWPSKFDAELASRIVGPNLWFKNYDMDAMMYLFREKTSLRRWKPDRVTFLNYFSLVNDENIQEPRHKIAYDLWEAANDEVLQYRMSTFKPPKRAPSKAVDLV